MARTKIQGNQITKLTRVTPEMAQRQNDRMRLACIVLSVLEAKREKKTISVVAKMSEERNAMQILKRIQVPKSKRDLFLRLG